MKMNPTLTRILWISDIHIWNRYKNWRDFRTELPIYFESALKSIKNYHIDYILLSGDVAFSGMKADYDYFYELFFTQVTKYINKDVKLLVVPGNHDICWETSSNLIETVNGTASDAYDIRTNQYLVDSNKETYLKNFQHYTNFLNSDELQGFFPKQGMNVTYTSHKLFGYHIDIEKRLVFILINTAWFSLGSNFNELIYEVNIKQFRRFFNCLFGSRKTVQDLLNNLLTIKDNIAEYGSQVIGSRLISELNLLDEVIEKYPDFTVLTIMHHPPNWLHWLDKYNSDRFVQKDNVFQSLLRHSNFVLTGHEHIPIIKSNEYFETDISHLKAGCFLEELKEGQNLTKYSNNRFSIIEIHTGKRNWLSERIVSYEPSTVPDEETHVWNPDNLKDPVYFDLKHASIPNNFRDKNFSLSIHLRDQGNMNLSLLEYETINYKIYREGNNFFVVSGNANAINDILSKSFISHLLSKVTLGLSKTKIQFIFKDVHCKSNLYDTLLDQNSNNQIRTIRLALFAKFNSEWKMKFDVFRNSYFSSLETDSISISEVMNIHLLFEVLPYWQYEQRCY